MTRFDSDDMMVAADEYTEVMEALADMDDAQGFEIDEYDPLTEGINPHLPTEHKPGSDGKILVMRARLAANILLYNDLDAK